MTEPFGARGGPIRRRLRERYEQRRGLEPPSDLTRETLEIGLRRRTYWLAPPPAGGPHAGSPLLIVLHGAGAQGPGTAALTGLGRRGPAAGFVTVFPDGVNRVWNDSRGAPATRRRQGVDDVAFLQALVTKLATDGRARGDDVYLAGISNGGLMSEHLARHGLLPAAGIGLVAGPGTQPSRTAMPRPVGSASVVVFAGTADPLMPYGGGPIGPVGRMAQRRDPAGDRGLAVGAETVAADWVAANGITGAPRIEAVTMAAPDDLPVTRTTWEEDGKPPVVLYRIDGGGHTWPGGAQYLPARFIGPVAPGLDATGIMLERFRAREADRR